MANSQTPSGWKTFRLSDLGLVDRGKSRHRPRYAAHLYGGPYPFIQTGDIKASGGRIMTFNQTYSEAGLAQSRLWPAETLAITIAANIAETAILTFPACFPDSIVGFLADRSVCEPLYIEYSFRTLRSRIQDEATGTVQDNINLEILRGLQLTLPPLDEQRAILRILRPLDDKIELNRRMNQTLEDICRALFKFWFVDFGPVRAKQEGRWKKGKSLPGMPADMWDLWPSEFEESEIGEIPKGWGATSLGAELRTVLGGTPPRSNPAFWTNGQVNWINSGEVNRFRITTSSDRITEEAVENSAAKPIPARTTVLAITGATIGQVSITEIATTTNQSVVAVIPSECIPTEFIYFWVRERMQDLLARQTGGAQQHINKNDVNDLPLLLPDSQVMGQYRSFAEPLFGRIRIGEFESLSLKEVRDALIPKLLSGEIRVKVDA